MSKEIRQFLKALDPGCWEVLQRKRGRHIHLRHRKTGKLVVCPKSPSDRRGLLNLQSEVRRAG